MTPIIQDTANATGCPAVDDETADDFAQKSGGGTGLFERQLSVAGLENVAHKLAAGGSLELDEAVRLSRTTLPLLGRIVQSLPCVDRPTNDHIGPNIIPPDGHANDIVLRIERVASTTELPRQVGQPLTDWEPFCRELVALRDELAKSSASVAWYPKVGRPPDENGCANSDYTGAEVLRAIALARLVLPANVQIVAPLAALGPKLAQVALEFGATHLGYAAENGQVLEGPLVVDASVLNELRRSCSPTSLKDDP
jgi:hypothetical protein